MRNLDGARSVDRLTVGAMIIGEMDNIQIGSAGSVEGLLKIVGVTDEEGDRPEESRSRFTA